MMKIVFKEDLKKLQQGRRAGARGGGAESLISSRAIFLITLYFKDLSLRKYLYLNKMS